jgi:hypothetical protein
MTKRRRLVLSFTLLLAAGMTFSLPPVYWRVVGWAKGEPFYRGRPTSWWRNECREYEEIIRAGGLWSRHMALWARRPGFWDQQVRKVFGQQGRRFDIDLDIDLPLLKADANLSPC